MSGGHLCEAEAPTEPAGETVIRRLAIRPLSLRSRVNGCGNPFFFSITDFFARSARNKKRGGYIAVSQSVDKPQVLFLRRLRRIYVFSLTRAAKKHLVSEKPLIQRFFKGTGVVLAGIECSPKISDFRANGIPVQERVDFFDTLRGGYIAVSFLLYIKTANIA